jgi:hypothetical protein
MSDRRIRDAVEQLSGTFNSDKVYVYDAEIVSVNESERSCVVITISGKTNETIPDVRLMASIDDGFFVIPVIGSTVTVINSTYTEPYVSTFSEVSKIVLMGGDLLGLLKLLPTLKSINTLETDLNNIKKAFTNWVVSPSDGGLALKTIAASWYGSQITKTVQSDLENTNITQG